MPPPSACLLSAWPASSGGPGAPAGAAAWRVLYVEDNAVNTLLMQAMFERLPGLVLCCESDPHRALADAVAHPPALLLIDIQMPGMDGIELLQRLRAAPATRHVPAIAVSANALPHDLARGRAAGFGEYLTKPLSLRRLQAALQAALPGWAPPAA